MMTSIMSSSSISSGGLPTQQKDVSKEEKNDNNCKETKSITNSSSGIGEGDNNMMDKPNCTRQVSSDNFGISARRLQDADGMQKKAGIEMSTSCDQQQQLSDAHQGYMASSPTHRQRNSEETIIIPTSVRSITLAHLYQQSRRSRHSDHTHRRSSNDSISMSSSILPPPPLVSGDSQEQEKIWMETATAISATNQEEWSFAPTLKTSTISQESHTFCSSNSLASIEMDEYDTTCLDDDMTVDTVFEGDDVQLLTKKEETPPAA